MKISHTPVKDTSKHVRGREKGKYTRGTSFRVAFDCSKTDLNALEACAVALGYLPAGERMTRAIGQLTLEYLLKQASAGMSISKRAKNAQA